MYSRKRIERKPINITLPGRKTFLSTPEVILIYL